MIKVIVSTLCISFSVFALSSSVNADITLSTAFGPKSLATGTIYISDDKIRDDSLINTNIWLPDASKEIEINTLEHTYKILTNLNSVYAFAVETNVVDTGKTTMLLGHLCHHYILTNKYSAGSRTDVLAAEDLKGPEAQLLTKYYFGPDVADKINGMPLSVASTINTNSAAQTVDIAIKVTAISTAQLPKDTFDIPVGSKLEK